jgi:excisionase family DNA binding protein
MMLQDKYFTVTQAAQYIGCTESYIRQLLRTATIRGEKVGERAWLIPAIQVETLKNTSPTGKPGRARKKNSKGS